MLHDGLPAAIRKIRLRKKLTQEQCAKRGKTTARTWSKYETGGKRITAAARPEILAGLDVAESEVWEEAVADQRDHYARRAAEIGEPAPGYNTSSAAFEIAKILALNVAVLPRSEQTGFLRWRNDVAASVQASLAMVDTLMEHYRRLEQEREEEDT